MSPRSYTIANGRTTVPLHLGERESVFVVFRTPAAAPSRTIPVPTLATLQTLTGPWSVSFPPNLGAPASLDFPGLDSWTANADAGVKYFSGTATYSRDLTASPAWFQPGAKLILDLGAVRDIAEISVNGQPLATLWKPPYQVDVSGVLKPGVNKLEIKVTNEWTNRLAGDAVAPPADRVFPAAAAGRRGGGGGAFGGPPTLGDSGLLGPVTIMARTGQ